MTNYFFEMGNYRNEIFLGRYMQIYNELSKNKEKSNKIIYDILPNQMMVLYKIQKLIYAKEIYFLEDKLDWMIGEKFLNFFNDLIYSDRDFAELLVLVNILDTIYPSSLKEYELKEKIYNINYNIYVKEEEDLFNKKKIVVDDREFFHKFRHFAFSCPMPSYALENLSVFIQKFKNIQEYKLEKNLPLCDLYIPKLFDFFMQCNYDNVNKNAYKLNIVTSILASDNVLENICQNQENKEYTDKLFNILETILKNQYEHILLNFIHNLINQNIKLDIVEAFLKHYIINYSILDFLYDVLNKYNLDKPNDIEFIKMILDKNYSKETIKLLFDKYYKNNENLETIKELLKYSENELIKRMNFKY